MKKSLAIIFLIIGSIVLVGCTNEECKTPEPEKCEGENPKYTFKYNNIHSNMDAPERTAVVAFYFEYLEYTEYQVVYTSCECRDAKNNIRTLARVEVKNGTNPTIQKLDYDFYGDTAFSEDAINGKDYTDMKGNSHTGKGEDQSFIATKILNKNKDELKSIFTASNEEQQGLVSGATVTAITLPRMLVGLIEFHERQNADKAPLLD